MQLKFYLIGIKGTGMSALAQVLVDLGYYVIGSDVSQNFFTETALKNKKIEYLEFNEKNIKDKDFIYIASSCYTDEFEEVKKVKENGYQFFYYHDFIEYFFKGVKIGISGAHGKTTTTSFVSDLFCNEPCCIIIGDGKGAGYRGYKWLIFEACEYKSHILSYSFDYLIINNIDAEHLDYFKNFNQIKETFKKASEKTKYLICNENIDINHENKYTFGQKEDSFCYYRILKEDDKGYELKVTIDKKIELNIRFNFTGIHMVYNLLAALVVYYLCFGKIDNTDLQNKINNFRKPNRRMDEYIYNNNILIDDYAHHPTEIKALIKAIKQKYTKMKIKVIFEPHTYSRTIALKKEFKTCFDEADEVYVANTFTSKREIIDEEKENEVKDIFKEYKVFKIELLDEIVREKNCVIAFVGAGTINKYLYKLLKM